MHHVMNCKIKIKILKEAHGCLLIGEKEKKKYKKKIGMIQAFIDTVRPHLDEWIFYFFSKISWKSTCDQL